MSATKANAARSSRPRTVWIVHDRGGLDFAKTIEFGAVRTLFQRDFNPFDLPRNLMHAEREFETCGSSDDLLVPVGSDVACMLAAVAFVRVYGKLRLLVFNSVREEYVLRDAAVVLRDAELSRGGAAP